jgi:hypothetical protein
MGNSKTQYRVVLACDGVPVNEGAQASMDITEQFKQRTWHQNVACKWDGRSLILQADNDFDPKGLALIDEFSDLISACVREPFDGDIRIVSITSFERGN